MATFNIPGNKVVHTFAACTGRRYTQGQTDACEYPGEICVSAAQTITLCGRETFQQARLHVDRKPIESQGATNDEFSTFSSQVCGIDRHNHFGLSDLQRSERRTTQTGYGKAKSGVGKRMDPKGRGCAGVRLRF